LPVVTLRGALVPFAPARDVRRQGTGRRFAPASGRRPTEAVGAERPAQHRPQAVTPATPPDGDLTLPERDGPRFAGTVADLGLDAVAGPQRAPGGGDGKRRDVGLLYAPGKAPPLSLVD
jgi:hypothetical protein